MKTYVKANSNPTYIKSVVEVSDNPNEVIDVSGDPDDTVYGVATFEDYQEFMARYKL